MSSATLVWRQYRLERRLFWRNPSAAFFNFALPLIFLFLFGAVFHNNQPELDVIVPGIAGMALLSTTFTALAYNMTLLREQGILKRMRGTPLPSGVYLGGLGCSALTNAFVQMTVIIVSGKLFFGLPWPRDWLELFVFVAAAVVCFAALGVALAHVIPNFDSATAYVNAIFLPVIIISGVFYDVKHTPTFLRDVASALPLKNAIDGLSGALVNGHGLGYYGSSLAVIVLWAVFAVILAVRGFSWEQTRT
jgi:ABC-2 type transport system permease protein